MPPEVARSAVEIAASGTRRVLDVASGRLAVFRLVVGGQHLDFLDGVRIHGHVDALIGAGNHVGGTVDGDFLLSAAGAVDIEASHAAVIGYLAADIGHHAGQHLHEVENIAPVERQVP